MNKEKSKELKKFPEIKGYQWAMIADVYGVYPLIKMECLIPKCRYHTLFLRHSMLFVERRLKPLGFILRGLNGIFRFFFKWRVVVITETIKKNNINRMAYKCPACDHLQTFNVPMPDDLWDHVLKLRNGDPLFYPDPKEWAKQDELIRAKLEVMNYV